MTGHEPLDPDIGLLIDAERKSPSAPADVKARLRARLGIVPPGTGGGEADHGSNPAPRMVTPHPNGTALLMQNVALKKVPLAIAFLGGLVVGGAVALLRVPKERIIYIDRPAAPVLSSTPESQPATPRSIAPPSASPSPVEATAPASSTATKGAPVSSLSAEQALLDGARVALGVHDAQAALRATDRHKQRFPSGALAEEREAIAIQALVLLARHDEAVARAEAFKRAYPASALLPAVEEAIGP